jgi:hypothetical protein
VNDWPDGVPPVIESEYAWRLEVWTTRDGVLVEQVDATAGDVERVRPVSKRLMLEVHLADNVLLLVHRAGWPFDLTCIRGNVAGRSVDTVHPTGAGDEVMRELLSACSSSQRTLVLRPF